MQGVFNIWKINVIHYINRTKENRLCDYLSLQKNMQLIKFNPFMIKKNSIQVIGNNFTNLTYDIYNYPILAEAKLS